ncbi:MAG: AAA family ATPase [Deltaproteobacteria bacterium]|nr:AAA family ATPase [Deltaproteobacteria bacterium]
MPQKAKTLIAWVALVAVFVVVFQLASSESSFGAALSSNKVLGGLAILAVLVIALMVFVRKQQQGGSANILSLGKSRARKAENTQVTFADVGGLPEAKEQLQDIIDFLQHSKRWANAGVRLPRGVLLEGPPGCGKTLLARAVAGEAKVPFFHISASEFVEMFVGVGASRVRDMFEIAKKAAPCVVFIDELDAVGRRRGSGIGSAHDEREQTLNQLLVSLDGFEQGELIVVIAATNRPDVLDKALLRPGRFDRRIQIESPSRAERLEMLSIHTKKKPLAPDVSIEQLAGEVDGFSGADIETTTNEAALLALRRLRGTTRDDVSISMADFRAAVEVMKRKERIFDKLDAVLIESASQLSQPTGKANVRVTLTGDAKDSLEGELVWADGAFLKLRKADGAAVIVPKHEVARIDTLAGTELEKGEAVGDRWAGKITELG